MAWIPMVAVNEKCCCRWPGHKHVLVCLRQARVVGWASAARCTCLNLVYLMPTCRCATNSRHIHCCLLLKWHKRKWGLVNRNAPLRYLIIRSYTLINCCSPFFLFKPFKCHTDPVTLNVTSNLHVMTCCSTEVIPAPGTFQVVFLAVREISYCPFLS